MRYRGSHRFAARSRRGPRDHAVPGRKHTGNDDPRVGLQTTYAAAGDALSDPELSAAETSTRYDWITHVEVSSSDADSQGAQGALLLEQRLQAARDRLSELARVKSIGAS
jgi:hypothetical protein